MQGATFRKQAVALIPVGSSVNFFIVDGAYGQCTDMWAPGNGNFYLEIICIKLHALELVWVFLLLQSLVISLIRYNIYITVETGLA